MTEALSGQDPKAAVSAQFANLPDTAEICGCNGVCKGAIVAGTHMSKFSIVTVP